MKRKYIIPDTKVFCHPSVDSEAATFLNGRCVLFLCIRSVCKNNLKSPHLKWLVANVSDFTWLFINNVVSL